MDFTSEGIDKYFLIDVVVVVKQIFIITVLLPLFITQIMLLRL